MEKPELVSRQEWLEQRRALLVEEKAHTRAREALAAKRRALPMVAVEKHYEFESERGVETLPELFRGRSQLVVYHFMFGPDWEQGCPSCSFWADNFSGIDVHLAARDTTFIAASNAPLATLVAYRERMGWRFDWVSARTNDFGVDFGVTFPDKRPGEQGYNYGQAPFGEEMPGLSAFRRLDDGTVAHTYSTYSRGLDAFNSAYHLLDFTSKGRDEAELPFTMAWVRRRDQY